MNNYLIFSADEEHSIQVKTKILIKNSRDKVGIPKLKLDENQKNMTLLLVIFIIKIILNILLKLLLNQIVKQAPDLIELKKEVIVLQIL